MACVYFKTEILYTFFKHKIQHMEFEKFCQFVRNFAEKKSIQPVIMFTGKREVPENEKSKLNAIGALLARECDGVLFRAGNQEGADKEFIANIPPELVQVVPPYHKHRYSHIPNGASTYPLDQIAINSSALTYFKKVEPGLHKAFIQGENGHLFQKSRYLLRNLAMLYGFGHNGEKFPQASILLYWDDPAKPKEGGTGFTINAAIAKGISPLGQKIWQKWL